MPAVLPRPGLPALGVVMTPEGKVKAAVKKVLTPRQQQGTLYAVWPVPSGYGESTLDCVGCYRGQFFAIETKARGKKPTPRQSRCIDMMVAAGGKVFVVDSVEGAAMVEKWLEELDAAG